MLTIWFLIIALMLVAYVILDGFDIGAGIIHYFVGRTGKERETVIAAIGPVWDGNEVWLLATGGTLYFAFPALYAASFSGFYLPLMMVLWLLIMRAAGHRTQASIRQRNVAQLLGFLLLSLKRSAGDFFRRGTRQCRARRAFGCRWKLFRAALDDIYRHG